MSQTNAEPTLITDSHTHLLPARLAAKIRQFFDAHIDGELAYTIEPSELLDRIHAEGIGHIWTLPYAHKAGMARQLNADIAALAAEHGQHAVTVTNGCTVHPDDPNPAEDLRLALDEHGARVLKLHCSVGDYQPDDPRLSAVFDLAGERRVPIVIHAGHGIDGSTNRDELAPMGRVAERHPETPIIIAHLGHSAHETAVALMDQHPNLYGDLTPVVQFPVPISTVDASRLGDRLLFGSDAPNTARPVTTLVDHLRALNLDAATFDAIMGGNAQRLLNNVR